MWAIEIMKFLLLSYIFLIFKLSFIDNRMLPKGPPPLLFPFASVLGDIPPYLHNRIKHQCPWLKLNCTWD